MSLFVPAPDCVVTTFLMEMDGQPVAVMPTFRKRVPPITIFNLTTFNSAIDTSFVTNVLPLLSQDVTYRLTQSRRQNVISDIAASTAANDGEVGEEGVALPSGCCARIEVGTGFYGRSNRGALYMPGVPRTKVTLNTLNEAWVQDLIDAWAQVATDAFTAGWQFVVRSKFTGNTPRVVALVQDQTAFAYHDLVVDYQRRRKPDPGITDGDYPDEQLFLA